MFNSDRPLPVKNEIISHTADIRTLLHKYVYTNPEFIEDLYSIINNKYTNASYNISKREIYADVPPSFDSNAISQCIFEYFNSKSSKIRQKIKSASDHDLSDLDMLYFTNNFYNRTIYDIMILNNRYMIKL